MNGYTLSTAPAISDQSDSIKQTNRLNLLNNLPLSVMVQSSFTNVAKDVPSQQNNSGQFPQRINKIVQSMINRFHDSEDRISTLSIKVNIY